MGQGDPDGEYQTLARPIAVRCFPFREIPLDEPPTPLARAVEVIELIFFAALRSVAFGTIDLLP